MDDEVIIKDVYMCSRCGENHTQIAFIKFIRPITTVDEHLGALTFTHWGQCPSSSDPILFAVVQKRENEDVWVCE